MTPLTRQCCGALPSAAIVRAAISTTSAIPRTSSCSQAPVGRNEPPRYCACDARAFANGCALAAVPNPSPTTTNDEASTPGLRISLILIF
jgi:hypothetical protein